MSFNSKQLVFLVGATGKTGLSIARGLAKHPEKFIIKSLIRPSTIDKPIVQELKSLGIKVVTGDAVDDSQEALEVHLKDVDTMISTILPMPEGVQTKLLLAAKNAGVKRVVPSEFGFYAPLGASEYLDSKLRTQKFIVDNNIPFTFIYVGGWASGLLPLPHSDEGDYATKIIRKQFAGSGKVKVAWTPLERVGDWVSRIISDPRTLNQTVQAWDGQATVEEGWAIGSKITGENFDDYPRLTEEEINSHISEGGMIQAIYQSISVLVVRGDTTVENAVAAGALDGRILYPDYVPLSLEEFAKDHYKNPEKM
ncbi:hypothetical protein V5O48_012633 [Marasmius crinis-equi]|uniref:NmrA-like domain-containing protein n=1 Tax=Marasmius crinis-equi TaxID=585013 RepID=A0ABR3F280_9AGAR